MITKRLLHVIRGNGSEDTYHLHTTATSYGSHLRVRIGGQDLYVPTMILGIGLKVIGANGTTYTAIDFTPKVWVEYNTTYDPQPYASPYKWISLSMTMQNQATINNAVYLQLYGNSGWYDVLSLSAGSTATASTSNIRSNNTSFRVRIGNTVIGTYDVGYSQGYKQVPVPEAQWGV